MRFFQHHEYISLDYARRDALRVGVKKPGPQPEFGFEKLAAPAVEPLRAELEAFAQAVRTGVAPKTDGVAGRAALELAGRVMQSIREHDERVKPVAKGLVTQGPLAKGLADKSNLDKASQ
jgi:predicted dehydrogenase